MLDDAKISVIIPVYKVERYLSNCMDSIINQTYRNLEIILVDDGSLDNCGTICEEYAKKDRRIKVIHQENRGLSAARNTGLQIATGDYLGFVDSDDWVELDMYEYLLQNLHKEQAHIAVCGHYEHSQKSLRPKGVSRRKACGRTEALGLLLQNDEIQNTVWDKLYRRELFAGIFFPEGRTYEDFAVMDQLFLRAERVVFLPEKKYYYRIRPNSISGTVFLGNQIDYYQMARRRCENLWQDWPQFRELLAGQCVASSIGIWACYYRNPKAERAKYRKQIKDAANFSKKNRKTALRQMTLGPVGKVILRLTSYDNCVAFAAAGFLGLLYRVRHGRNL